MYFLCNFASKYPLKLHFVRRGDVNAEGTSSRPHTEGSGKAVKLVEKQSCCVFVEQVVS